MNKVIIRYAIEKSHEVVGVIGKHNIGENPLEVAGLKNLITEEKYRELKISKQEDAEKLTKEKKPDICILATRSTAIDIFETMKTLGALGINVVTICEELFYSWTTAKDMTSELDELFKKNGVSFTGTGTQDIFWGFLPVCVMGSSHTIKKIKGHFQFNVEDYGRALCEAHGVGLTVEEFDKTISNSDFPSYNWNSNEWLANTFGWKVKKMVRSLLPITIEEEINCKVLNRNILPGIATGLKSVVVTECENGIVIETEMIGRVYFGDMMDICAWTIQGEPDTEIVVKRPATVEITCATAVNRLQQVFEARSGYVPSFELGLAPWRV